MRIHCDLLRDCQGWPLAEYMVWLDGSCRMQDECEGHPACAECLARARQGVRDLVVTRCCTLAVTS